jgi:hypothetical protein
MKRHCARVLLGLVVIAATLPVFADDQEKAEKQLHKITAMATDATGRRVVSITVADALGAKRPDLVNERRAMNLNYGDLFIAHQLVKNGAKMDDIAAQLKAGKNISQIATEQHLDWKQMTADAKKLNSKMEDRLYKHFMSGKDDAARDAEDNYDPNIDGVTADNSVSQDEIAEAQHTYEVWHERAERAGGSNLDTSTEKAAQGVRGDPVRSKAGSLSNPKQ